MCWRWRWRDRNGDSYGWARWEMGTDVRILKCDAAATNDMNDGGYSNFHSCNPAQIASLTATPTVARIDKQSEVPVFQISVVQPTEGTA
jgi:hypothetical protein